MDDKADICTDCPFCGSESHLMMDDEDRFYVMCLECRACGPCADSCETALTNWIERFDESHDFGAKRLLALN